MSAHDIAGVERNYRVVGLARSRGKLSVVVLVDDEPDYQDSGLTVSEFVDPTQLKRGGIFGYFSPEERAIFRRGLTPEGEDLNPDNGKARKRDLVGPLADGTQICRLCDERKPLDEFSRYKESPTGLRNYCKDCATR